MTEQEKSVESFKPIFRFLSGSEADTEQAGRSFAAYLLSLPQHSHVFVAMYGDLGVGKTAFVRGAVSILVPSAVIQSPTYTIVNEYTGVHGAVFHFDMYRIESEDDLYSIGFWDYFDRPGIAFVEWSEKIPYALPPTYFSVTIQKPDDVTKREITIKERTGE